MRKLLFLSVITSLCMSVLAQVEVRKFVPVPTQKQPEKIDAELLFAPKIEKITGNHTASKPKRKSIITYTPYKGWAADANGRVSNLAFSAWAFGDILPDVSNIQNDWLFANLFPDSTAFRFQFDLGNPANTGKYTMFSSTGFIFDPYSLSFGDHTKGLFENDSGVMYEYRLDTLWTYVDYRLQGYNPASPDTLRFDITYFDVYTYPDTVEYIIIPATLGTTSVYLLSPKVEYPNPIPQKGIGPVMKSTQITVDYILGTKDSLVLAPGYVWHKQLCIPIPGGFEVPAGSVLGVVARYIPGYNYNLNDTLEVSTWNSTQFISQSIKKNIFSIASWDYDNNTQIALFDRAGVNTFFVEDKAVRYKKPTSANETLCVDNSVYNPLNSVSPALWMSLSVDPCGYPVNITSNINGSGDLVLKMDNPFDTYTWSTGANTSSITVTNPGTYWVRVTNSGGCNSADTTIVIFEKDTVCDNVQYDFHGRILTTAGTYATTIYPNTYKIELEMIPAPPAPTVTRNGFTFTSSSTDSDQQWYWGDSLLVGAVGQTFEWTNTGKYSVEVSTANGCTAKGEISVYGVSGRVRIGSTTAVGNLTIRNRGDSVTVTEEYTGNYIFYVDGGTQGFSIQPDTTPYIEKYGKNPFTPRMYNANVPITTDYTGRNFTDTVTKVGLPDITADNPIRLYPNPTTGQLIIENGELTIDNVEIYSIIGQLLQSTPFNSPEGGKLPSSGGTGGGLIIDVSHLPAGLYFLKVNNKVLKFVKE